MQEIQWWVRYKLVFQVIINREHDSFYIIISAAIKTESKILSYHADISVMLYFLGVPKTKVEKLIERCDCKMWVTLIKIWTYEPHIPPEDQRNTWAGHKDQFLNLHNLKVKIADWSFPAVNLLLRQFIPKWKHILWWGHQVTAWCSRKNGSLIVSWIWIWEKWNQQKPLFLFVKQYLVHASMSYIEK